MSDTVESPGRKVSGLATRPVVMMVALVSPAIRASANQASTGERRPVPFFRMLMIVAGWPRLGQRPPLPIDDPLRDGALGVLSALRDDRALKGGRQAAQHEGHQLALATRPRLLKDSLEVAARRFPRDPHLVGRGFEAAPRDQDPDELRLPLGQPVELPDPPRGLRRAPLRIGDEQDRDGPRVAGVA